MTDALADGVYFDLAAETYHALPRLSASGVCNLLVSPATFWVNSWLNPDRNDEDTPATRIGRAYHMARLEPDRFARSYVRKLTKADMPEGTPMTHDDIAAQLHELGKQGKRSGESVLEAAKRLRDAGYPGPIWHIEAAQWEASHGDEEPIDGELFDQLIDDSERLHQDPDVSRLLTDGFPEVSILWHDAKGRPWKARLDWLAAQHVADLKTFANPQGRPLDKCVADAVRWNKLYVQGAIYFEAAIRAHHQDFPTDGNEEWLEQFRSSPQPQEYWWVFIEKGVPNVLARQFRMTREAHPHHLYQAPDAESREELRQKLEKAPSMLYRKALAEIELACSVFDRAMAVWGAEEPWGALEPVGEIGDDDYPPQWLEE